jgi:hypothetical protein
MPSERERRLCLAEDSSVVNRSPSLRSDIADSPAPLDRCVIAGVTKQSLPKRSGGGVASPLCHSSRDWARDPVTASQLEGE